MKKANKNRWILYLMVLSECLLLTFVVYWLRGQFNEEHTLLSEDLSRQFFTSQDQMLDSVLLKHVINPIRYDTTEVVINLEKGLEKVEEIKIFDYPDKNSTEEKFPADSVLHFFKFDIKDSVGGHYDIQIKKNEVQDEMLMRSVKLLVQSSEKQTNIGEGFHSKQFPMDTLLFQQLFEEKINEEGYKVNVVWFSADQRDSLNPKKLIFKSDVDASATVEIDNYQGYLFAQILPEFFFSLFLLLLTGSAFFFAYRNILKQQLIGKMRESFISNITHELKTPVSTVKVALEAINNFNASEIKDSQKEYIEMAWLEANRLDKLINHILSNAKMESNQEMLNLKQVKIEPIISSVLESMKAQLLDKKAQLSIVDYDNTLEINADAFYIESVLRNLIDNSLKYSDKTPEIELSVSNGKNSVRISVKDNGEGIPRQFQQKIFEKFFRVPKGDTHNVKGYGLGLSYAQQIMKLHGGDITIKNLEAGCVFTISFPKS